MLDSDEDPRYNIPLFGTKVAKGRRNLFRCYVASVFVGIILICLYRIIHFPSANGQVLRRWAWMGLFLSELWFSLYWFVSQFSRWNPIHRYTFRDRLSQRSFLIFIFLFLLYIHLLIAYSETIYADTRRFCQA